MLFMFGDGIGCYERVSATLLVLHATGDLSDPLANCYSPSLRKYKQLWRWSFHAIDRSPTPRFNMALLIHIHDAIERPVKNP